MECLFGVFEKEEVEFDSKLLLINSAANLLGRDPSHRLFQMQLQRLEANQYPNLELLVCSARVLLNYLRDHALPVPLPLTQALLASSLRLQSSLTPLLFSSSAALLELKYLSPHSVSNVSASFSCWSRSS